jgi:hypothetical protein
MFVGRGIINKMPGDSSSLDPDTTMQVPPARKNSHQDIDAADLTLDSRKHLEFDHDSAVRITNHPFSTPEWDSVEYKKSPSRGEKPEQSNASALEAAEKRIMYFREYFHGNWAKSDSTKAAAFSDDLTPLSAPAMRPTPDNAESQHLETGSYDTTRSTYFYPDDTARLDIRQRDQTPATRRPQFPLSPTTTTAEPSWRNTSASGNVLDPASSIPHTSHAAMMSGKNAARTRRQNPPLHISTTKKNVESPQRNTSDSEDAATEHPQTFDEAQEQPSRKPEEETRLMEERLDMWRRTLTSERQIFFAPYPPQQDTSPDYDALQNPSTAHNTAPTPSEPGRNSDFNMSPLPRITKKERKQREKQDRAFLRR